MRRHVPGCSAIDELPASGVGCRLALGNSDEFSSGIDKLPAPGVTCHRRAAAELPIDSKPRLDTEGAGPAR